MANEEVLGPRKTMFVLVIVVGCFAVLWPRILAPLILGHTREQLKPNEFDREAGCCEVMFETELAVLELINEVCSSAIHVNGKLSPYAAAECRKAVNDTCGMDIAVFLKRTENVGKTSKILIHTMKESNSSCLKEHFGVAPWSYGPHPAINSWTIHDTMKQERPPIRAGQHPALRERGRAIPPGSAPPGRTVAMPPHVRVWSPLSVYYELDIKPPPIPGMRPPLGSPGGPVPAPKTSMGFVMPIYTICIIVFFVYTLSKILFKRSASPYEPVSTDPQFRRRVFREDSRTTPDKLVVTAISGLVAEVQQQMEANYGHTQQRQDAQDNTRSYTNGTILHNSGPVHIVASEYREPSKEKSPELQRDHTRQTKETLSEQDELELEIENTLDAIETLEDMKESSVEFEEIKPEEGKLDTSTDLKESIPEAQVSDLDSDKIFEQLENSDLRIEETKSEEIDSVTNHLEVNQEEDIDMAQSLPSNATQVDAETKKDEAISEDNEVNNTEDNMIKLAESSEDESDVAKLTEYFIEEETRRLANENQDEPTTRGIVNDIINDAAPEPAGEDEQENASVKVMGMEVTAHSADGGAWVRPEPPLPAPPQPQQQRPHEAEEVKSIFLETEIPQKSRVLVTDFVEDRPEAPKPANSSPMVVSGKMTLSLIQDEYRGTPERDPESTVDDFTTASAVTQPAADKVADDESEEEIEEEIEIEEIEEEVEDEEDEEVEPTKGEKETKPTANGTQ